MRFLLMFMMVLAANSSWGIAQGEACSDANAVALSGQSGLICDGANWQKAYQIEADGGITLTQSIKLSDDTAACNGTTAGTLRYNSNQLEYCNGTAWTAPGASAGGGGASYTEIKTSTTWTKPASGNVVRVQCVGGGGGGAAYNTTAGGGGGGYIERWFAMADLPASVTVTIGAGGGGGASSGGTGGTTTFGTILTAYGGTGGTAPSGSGGTGGGTADDGTGITLRQNGQNGTTASPGGDIGGGSYLTPNSNNSHRPGYFPGGAGCYGNAGAAGACIVTVF